MNIINYAQVTVKFTASRIARYVEVKLMDSDAVSGPKFQACMSLNWADTKMSTNPSLQGQHIIQPVSYRRVIWKYNQKPPASSSNEHLPHARCYLHVVVHH
jgi:hypothetical protein